jgi:hypothetical protein
MPSAGGRTSLDAIRAGREALSREHVATPRQRGQREALRVLQVFIDAARPFADEPVQVAARVLDHAAQAWPSLVTVSAAAVQTAAGVSIAKQAWESVRSAHTRPSAAEGRAGLSAVSRMSFRA